MKKACYMPRMQTRKQKNTWFAIAVTNPHIPVYKYLHTQITSFLKTSPKRKFSSIRKADNTDERCRWYKPRGKKL